MAENRKIDKSPRKTSGGFSKHPPSSSTVDTGYAPENAPEVSGLYGSSARLNFILALCSSDFELPSLMSSIRAISSCW